MFLIKIITANPSESHKQQCPYQSGILRAYAGLHHVRKEPSLQGYATNGGDRKRNEQQVGPHIECQRIDTKHSKEANSTALDTLFVNHPAQQG